MKDLFLVLSRPSPTLRAHPSVLKLLTLIPAMTPCNPIPRNVWKNLSKSSPQTTIAKVLRTSSSNTFFKIILTKECLFKNPWLQIHVWLLTHGSKLGSTMGTHIPKVNKFPKRLLMPTTHFHSNTLEERAITTELVP